MKRLVSGMDADDIRAWRVRRALTIEKAAETLGVSKRAIIHYEGGEYPVPVTIARLCEALDQLDRLRKK